MTMPGLDLGIKPHENPNEFNGLQIGFIAISPVLAPDLASEAPLDSTGYRPNESSLPHIGLICLFSPI